MVKSLNSSILQVFNPLPQDKILDFAKLTAYADDKRNVTQKLKFDLGRVENIMEKGENAGNPAFSLFPHNVFKTFLSRGC